MGREGLQLRMDLRVVPVGPMDGRFEVVDDQPLRHAAEMVKRVFQASEKRLGALAIDGLAVAFATMAQDDPKDPRPSPLAVGRTDRRGGAEIDLGLLASGRLQASERKVGLLFQPTDEPPHTIVAGREFRLPAQILMDPHRGESLLDFLHDELPERLTVTSGSTHWWRTSTSAGPFRPGGRLWLVLSLELGDVLANRLAVDAQQLGDLPIRMF